LKDEKRLQAHLDMLGRKRNGWLTMYEQNGKQGENKSLAEANAASMAEATTQASS
jgi:hypothetical protein